MAAKPLEDMTKGELEAEVKRLKKEIEASKILEKSTIAQTEYTEARVALRERELEALREQLGLMDKFSAHNAEALANLEKEIAKKDLLLQQEYHRERIQSEVGRTVNEANSSYLTGLHDITSAIGQASDGTSVASGQFMKFASLINAFRVDWKNTMATITSNITQMAPIILMRIGQELYNLGKAGWELTKQIDGMTKEMVKNTGASFEMRDAVVEAYTAQRIYGVTAEKAFESTNALLGNFTQFTEVTKGQQQALIETANALALNGVNQESFAKNVEFGVKTLRMSTTQIKAQQLRLAAFAKDIRMAPGEISEAFSRAGPTMAKFTINAESAFKDLMKTVKDTGMAMEDILSITNKFDTFEGASQQVGKLNAMLGGDFVNALELMEAESPEERFSMITDAIHGSGMAFESMSYWEKIAVANAAGFKDVEEMSKALSGSVGGLSMANARNAATMEATEKRGQALLTIKEKLQAIVTRMTPLFLKLADGLNVFIDGFMDFVDGAQFGDFVEQLSRITFMIIEFVGVALKAAFGFGSLKTGVNNLIGGGAPRAAAFFSGLALIMGKLTEWLTIAGDKMEDWGAAGFEIGGKFGKELAKAGGVLGWFIDMAVWGLDKILGMIPTDGPFSVLAAGIQDARHWLLEKKSSPTFFESLLETADRILKITKAAGRAAMAISAINISVWLKFAEVIREILPLITKIGEVIGSLMSMTPLGILARGVNKVLGPAPTAVEAPTLGAGAGGTLTVTTSPTINLVVKVFGEEVEGKIIAKAVEAVQQEFNLK